MGDGFLAVDKPGGITSHDVVAEVRRRTGIRRAGHAGTLDPLATGLVVVGLGRATRLLRFIADQDKEYLASVCFGIATDTLDADGKLVERREMPISAEDLRAVLPRFLGEIKQVPPMVSALKVGGRRLYDLARQGVDLERVARPIQVRAVELQAFVPGPFPEATVRVVCGKGTYVRVLADDIAKALGGRAHLLTLRRLRTGVLSVAEQGIPLWAIEAETWRAALVGMAEGLAHLPSLVVDGEAARRVASGQRLAAPSSGLLRVIDSGGGLLAVYRAGGGWAVPEVVVA